MPLRFDCPAAGCSHHEDYRDELVSHQRAAHPGERFPEPESRFVPHRNETGQPLRELGCRRCGGWVRWKANEGAQPSGEDGRWDPEADGGWFHTADDTPMCVPFDLLAAR